MIKKLKMSKEDKLKKIGEKRLLKLIDDARRDLWDSRKGFNETNDDDMIEYFIYERRAYELRYLHLLKLYKSAGYAAAQPSISDVAG